MWIKNNSHNSLRDALDKSQAIIEFSLDGVIVDANDNFLNTMGYTLAEIKGKYHRIFVDPDYADSEGYAHFWEKLQGGEFTSAEYQRIGKNGKDVWIQASYNPILDMNGKPFKVVKFATDITRQVKARLQVTDLTTRTQDSVQSVTGASQQMQSAIQ